ncbi:MAG: ATP-binding protein [Actinomycetota bacterium]|nr:ATP-binding protein [Actinomycetota bacterium]
MSRLLRRVGLRERLAFALAAVAVLSVAVGATLATTGLDGRLGQFARARLHSAADHGAELAATLYRTNGGWTKAGVIELGHLAEIDGYRLRLSGAGGRVLSSGSLPGGTRASEAVRLDGVTVGTVTLAPVRGQILTGEDRSLQTRLIDLDLIATGVAVVLGLLAAAGVARALARPLSLLTDAARRMQNGELDVRVKPAGAPELKQLAQAFNRLSETLEHLERIRRDAAADVAHELRTPLAGIVSRIEAAQDGVLPDEQANLEAMHTEALRLARLIADIGKLAEAQQPGLTLKKESIDLRELAEQRIGLQRDALEDKQINLDTRLDEALAYGDRGRIIQIIDNLLSNAVRYTDHGGTVTVETSADGAEARLGVADTGTGISGEDLPYIFERFWRGEPSRARATGGAGIGLAIVAELVRAHGGRIDVESRPGVGSRFTVTLPSS